MNFSGHITHFFLKNAAFTWLVFFSAIFLGVFGYFSMPKQYNPEVTLPAFSIFTQYPGASAQEVEKFVTREIEEKISEIPGIDSISSQSIDGGVSIVRAEFIVGEDLEEAKVKLFSKIQENLDYLEGKNIQSPQIKNISPDDIAIGIFAISSEEFSQNILREKALSLTKTLQETNGIANIEVWGGEKKSLSVQVHPLVLKERNLSFTEVENALKNNIGKRVLGERETKNGLVEIQIDTSIETAESAKKILIAPGVFLGEIANVTDGSLEKKSSIAFFDANESKLHKNVVFISFAKKKGENTSAVMNEASKNFYKALESEKNISGKVVRNTAEIADEAIFGLGKNLITSIIIVSVLLLLFLGSRPAFLVALAIPLTMLGVLFFGSIFDQTINRITLFALILSLGLLVDSATVVVENIYRHLSKHRKNISEDEKNFAIAKAIDEVGIGLFLSTLTSVIVFLPLTQITGMMGPYMGPLAFFVPTALVCSLLVAYSIIPFLAKLLIHVPVETDKNEEKKTSFFDIFASGYEKLLRKVLENDGLQKKVIWGAFGTLFAVFSLVIFQVVQFQMLPKADNDTLWVSIDLPKGSDDDASFSLAQKVIPEISQIPDVSHVQIFSAENPIVDFNGLFRGFAQRKDANQSSLLITFQKDRQFSSEENAKKIRKKIDKFQKKSSQKFLFSVVEDPPGPPVQATLVAKIFSTSPESRSNIIQEVENIFRHTHGIIDIDSSIEETYSRISFRVDPQKAKENQVTNANALHVLSYATGPQIIGEFYPPNAQEISFVELKTPKVFREQLNNFSEIFVKNTSGKMIPLSSIVKQEEKESVLTQYRNEHKALDYVTAEMEGRSVIYAVIDSMIEIFNRFEVEKFSLYQMQVKDPSTGESVEIVWGGEFEMTLDNFRDLGIAMCIAFFLVYMILVAQFSCFKIPLLLMSTVPLAMIGILPGFALLGQVWGIPLTATGLIGFIALLGIVVNNAIIFLEYLEVVKAKGSDLLNALVLAGKTRLRPIMLTSLTTVLGSLTIALDPVWSGLAWSIVFGLSLSTILTLGIFPILYYRSMKK